MINDPALKEVLLGYALTFRHQISSLASLARGLESLSQAVLERDPSLSEVLQRKTREVEALESPLIQDALKQFDEIIQRLKANEVAW